MKTRTWNKPPNQPWHYHAILRKTSGLWDKMSLLPFFFFIQWRKNHPVSNLEPVCNVNMILVYTHHDHAHEPILYSAFTTSYSAKLTEVYHVCCNHPVKFSERRDVNKTACYNITFTSEKMCVCAYKVFPQFSLDNKPFRLCPKNKQNTWCYFCSVFNKTLKYFFGKHIMVIQSDHGLNSNPIKI